MFGPYLQEHLPLGKTAVLFQDHLKCQKSAGYINKLHSFNCESLYGPANKTEMWQPIDAGHVGACIKSIATNEWDKWLDMDTVKPGTKNWNLYIERKLSQSQKRIITTHIVGNAWETWCGSAYDHMRMNAFVQTGCALTTTGKNDSLVHVEGYHASIDIPHERLNDMDYINYSWSKGPTFLPAEHVEVVDSPSEGSSESDSDSQSESDSPESD